MDFGSRIPHPASQHHMRPSQAGVMGPPATPGMPHQVSRPTTPNTMARPQPAAQHMRQAAGTHMQMPSSQSNMPQYRSIQPKPTSGLVAPHKATLLPATPHNLATMNPELVISFTDVCLRTLIVSIIIQYHSCFMALQVACNWLRANYEPCADAIVTTAKVHQEYSTWLQRRAVNGATAVQGSTFVACIKRVFPCSELVVNGPESQISGIVLPAVTIPTLSNSFAHLLLTPLCTTHLTLLYYLYAHTGLRWKPPQNPMGPTSQPPPYHSQHLMQPNSNAPPRIGEFDLAKLKYQSCPLLYMYWLVHDTQPFVYGGTL